MRDRDLKEILYIRVPPYLRAAIEREAARQDEPIATTMRRILREKLNAIPPGKGRALRNGMATVRRVQEALEARGIEFQNHGNPGVRLIGTPASKGEDA